jgi:NAD(P)H-dependent flavin oxidoreductase YrpB (nitropropane dioxygenase family)
MTLVTKFTEAFGVEHPVAQGGMQWVGRADGINMGTRFMCTVESCIHQNVKDAIVAGDERGTELIFRSLHNTARVASNVVSREVVEILKGGGQFEDVKDLVAGVRGRKVFDDGDIDAGIWTVGTVMGLIHDIPTVEDLITRIVEGAEDIIIGRLADMVVLDEEEKATA